MEEERTDIFEEKRWIIAPKRVERRKAGQARVIAVS